MLNILVISIILLITPQVFGTGKKALKDQVECSPRDLDHKDCLLRLQQLEVRLNNEKIVTDDGVWKNVDILPEDKGGIEWERVRLSSLGGMIFLEAWVWESAKGEAELQNLNWHVAVIKDAKLTFKVKETVSRRRQLKESQSSKKYLNDKIEEHGLKIGPKDVVVWFKGKKSSPLF